MTYVKFYLAQILLTEKSFVCHQVISYAYFLCVIYPFGYIYLWTYAAYLPISIQVASLEVGIQIGLVPMKGAWRKGTLRVYVESLY